MHRRKQSPDVEIEYEDFREQLKIIDFIERDKELIKEVREEASREEGHIEDLLARVGLLDKFNVGEVWITVIPEKPENLLKQKGKGEK